MKYFYALTTLVVAIVVLTFVSSFEDTSTEISDNGDSQNERRVYINEEYGFSFDYDSKWTVAEYPEDEIAPSFSVYRPFASPAEPPFTHHSDATQVSIFPHGVPTEGVFGERGGVEVDFVVPMQEVVGYVLSDGTPWAVYANLANAPEKWEEYGFAWGAVHINNLEVTCLRGNEWIPSKQCDPFTGDEIVRDGEVNKDDWSEVVRILESIQFIYPQG